MAKYKAGSEDKGQIVALKVIVKKEISPTATDKEHVKAEHYCLTSLFLIHLIPANDLMYHAFDTSINNVFLCSLF